MNLKTLSTPNQFKDWLSYAQPGEPAVYHVYDEKLGKYEHMKDTVANIRHWVRTKRSIGATIAPEVLEKVYLFDEMLLASEAIAEIADVGMVYVLETSNIPGPGYVMLVQEKFEGKTYYMAIRTRVKLRRR